MATSKSDENVFIFKCAICLEKLKNPRCLPCLHSFCERCVQSLIKSSSMKKPQGQKVFECPVCRTEVTSPEPDISDEEWSSKFPLNRLILSLEEYGDEKVDINCDPCSRVEETNVAKYRCIDCRENMCETCYSVSYHIRLKGSSSHKVFDLSENSPSEKIDNDEHCIIHENREVDAFCFDHESFCCSQCSVTKHRKCQTVKTIDEIVNKEEEGVNFNELKLLIDNIASKTTKFQDSTKENIKTLEEKQTGIMDMVSSHIDEVKDKLDQLRDQFQKKVDQTHFDEKQTLELIDGCLSGFLITLEDCKLMASVVSLRGSKRQQFFTMQRIKTQISSHMKKIEKLTKDRGKSVYVFKKSRKFYDTTTSILNADDIGDINKEFSKCNDVIGIQKILYPYLYKSVSNELSEITFRHTFENVSTFEQTFTMSQTTPVFRVRNITWGVVCFHEKNDLCAYLVCDVEQHFGNLKWSCRTEAEVRIINHIVERKSCVQNKVHVFTQDSRCLGYRLMTWDTLLNSANGFIRDNKLTLEVQIKADVPRGLS